MNWKMSSALNPNNTDFMAYKMDSRGPYGSIGWDGKTKSSGASEVVTRMDWGAGGQRFVATAANGVRNSTAWTYNTPDAVNYTRAQAASDLEFGIVQTAVDKFMGYQEFVTGRIVGKTSANYGNACPNTGTLMPCSYGWPYQMMQYSAPDGMFGPAPTTGKLMAWGTPYGWLGAQSFPSFDYSTTAMGVGERTYGTFIAWGRRGLEAAINEPVNSAKAFAETASVNTSAQINDGFGTVARNAANPGSMFMRSLSASGYNANYSAFEVNAAANKVDVTYGLNNAPNPLINPIVIVNSYNGAAPALKWNGIALVSVTDYLASYDP